MKCPTCNGRGKHSRPCQLSHATKQECYDADCFFPRACQTCAGEGKVVTDAMLEADARSFLERRARKTIMRALTQPAA